MRTPTLLVLLAAAASPAAAQIEVSEDGRLTASPDTAAPRVVVPRGATPVFGTTPDWQNTLRRQVGALEIGDLNNDGFNDLAVGCYISNSFPPYDDWRNLIYFGTPTGLETEPSWVSADQVSTADIKLGDINLDGHLDIFTSNGGSAFSDSVIYFGSPTGPSTTAGWIANEPEATFSLGVALFDVDNDGDLDAITTNQGITPDPFRRMYLFVNDNGSLPTTPAWQSDDRDIQNTVTPIDYDGDGFLDIAVSKWANFESGIIRNNGGTLDTTLSWTTGSTTTDRGTAAADFDQDGDADLVIGRSGTSNPSSSYSNGSTGPTPVFTEQWVSGAPFIGVQDIRAADIDQDGDADIGEVHFSDGRAHIYLNDNGTIPSTPSWTYDSSAVGTAIVFGDLNNDGVTDVAIGYSGEPSIVVFYGLAVPCPADTNGNGTLDPGDFTAWVVAYNGGSPACDQNGDGACTRDDFTAWVVNFNAGCP
ncbi:MAG: FG-GAP-like repeat-containing protein [Phycisphaerales bacterium]